MTDLNTFSDWAKACGWDAASLRHKTALGVSQRQQREHGIVKAGRSAPEHDGVAIVGRRYRRQDSAFDMGGHPDLDHAHGAVRVVGLVVLCKPIEASLPDTRNPAFAKVADDEGRDQILSAGPCIHHQKSDPIDGRKQRADDSHANDSLTVITESENGLGIHGEIIQPAGEQDADPSALGYANIVVDLDGDTA